MVSRGCIGRRVSAGDLGTGVLSFYGTTSLGPGDWCGITLDEPKVRPTISAPTLMFLATMATENTTAFSVSVIFHVH